MSETEAKKVDADAEECRKHGKPCCIAFLVILAIATVCGIWTCIQGDPKPRCPDVVPASEPFTVDLLVEIRIDLAVEELLLDPGSYEQDAIYAMKTPIFTRDDGSQYYGRYEVEFRASNAFGGIGTGIATVGLKESEDRGCVVTGAYLH